MSLHAFDAIRIVLVEPAGPLNVGAIARVMKNFGLSQLVLVNPQCDPLGEEARRMAVHASDLLVQAQSVSSLPEALAGCQQAVATTARSRHFEAPLLPPAAGLAPLLATPAVSAAIIFGPEDRGLSNQELVYAQRFIRIPSDQGYPVLNLAQAVAICCYELYGLTLPQIQDDSAPDAVTAEIESFLPKTLPNSPNSDKQSATAVLDELEGFYQQLESVLLKIGYLYPHTAASRMRKFRRLLHRAAPSSGEVALLRGILRQVEWASQSAPTTPDPP
ncbi:RNA methyltransferase [Romeria aff. gracilis LEGE 07310]|uniref:tRNA (cytidine/uridine-2'-O-)-methyltransferase TrmJ n=1 Tax=Vasconcelosia minhoensis LEGE 07310 TaxID=915328 RepID=A0A8J7AID1_9CYAN|nr:RNA methyltransferase [Romeria gracilis]MBE9075960.1 RNA methyltransferase [Romeria aff. gracilis LEGE 07310]